MHYGDRAEGKKLDTIIIGRYSPYVEIRWSMWEAGLEGSIHSVLLCRPGRLLGRYPTLSKTGLYLNVNNTPLVTTGVRDGVLSPLA
jgi:hypothetical protein